MASNQFQSPIGTSKTKDTMDGMPIFELFQSPIGTNKTFAPMVLKPLKKGVSIPYRYKQNRGLGGLNNE